MMSNISSGIIFFFFSNFVIISAGGNGTNLLSAMFLDSSMIVNSYLKDDSLKDIEFDIDRNDELKDVYNIRAFDSPQVNAFTGGSKNKNFAEKLKDRLRQRNLPLKSNSTLSGYVVQYVDHFNKTDARKWKQYFFYNLNFSKPDNKLNFLYIGGEGPITEATVLEDSWMMMDWARQYSAAAYSLEHRYYGRSLPTGFDHSVSQLKYLSSSQALADIARFIKAVNRQRMIRDSKWIVFGGSYAGNLAAWLRRKYPHLVHAAVASSAPVRAVVDFSDYYLSISNLLRKASFNNCLSNVNEFFGKAQELLRTSQGRKSLGICSPRWDNTKDTYHFFDDRLSEIAVELQGDCPDRPEITGICSMYAGLAENNSTTSRQVSCVDSSYSHYIHSLRNPKPFWLRSWFWQMCTEFGYFQTVYSNGAFGNVSLPLKYVENSCADIFGSQYNRTRIESAVAHTNRIYGGADRYSGTNVVFTYGSEDPWQALSVQPSTNNSYIVINIEGTSHCRDLFPPTPSDPPSLRWARHVIDMELGKWISS